MFLYIQGVLMHKTKSSCNALPSLSTNALDTNQQTPCHHTCLQCNPENKRINYEKFPCFLVHSMKSYKGSEVRDPLALRVGVR